LPFVLFVVGVVVVVWATEHLLEGLVGLAGLLRVSAFAVAAVLSGFEAENVAVGLAAARKGAQEVALGTVFGGAIFLVCVALGLGAMWRIGAPGPPAKGSVAGELGPVSLGLPYSQSEEREKLEHWRILG